MPETAWQGPAPIDGNGAKFFTGGGDATGPGDDRSQAYVNRPHLIVFYRCTNLVMRDVFLTASAYRCTRILECRYVRFDGVRIHNRVNKNNDGFHFNSSQHVAVANCDIACQDDACALFGSNKFVTVTNCAFSTRWSIFRFGVGEPENIAISNCLIHETCGCLIKMAFGRGSRAGNLSFSNIVMKNVTSPITGGLGQRVRRQNATGEPPPQGIAAAESLLRFIDTRDTLITAARVLTPASAFLQIEGAGSAGITIDGGDISKPTKPLTATLEAVASAVKLRV